MNVGLQHIRKGIFRKDIFAPVKIEYNSHQYIPAFDGWRGVGVILVVSAHCFPNTITRPFWVAMDLFFVMSGFLITGILLDSKTNQHYYRNYITRRVLRVFPVYYFVLFLSFIIIPWLWPHLMGSHYDYYLKHQAWFWLYGQNWLFSITGFPQNHTMVHFWSLAVEEQFYLLWPLLVKIFDSKKMLKVCIGIALFSIYFRMDLGFRLGFIEPYRYMATLSRMDSISIGAMIAILIRNNKQWLEKHVSVFALISALCAVAGVIYYRSANFLAVPSIYTFVDIFSGCILLYSLSLNKPWIIRIGDLCFFRFLGKYSYGIYIYHYIIFNILFYNVQPIFMKYFSRFWITEGLIGILTFCTAVFISLISYKYLELPFLKLKKYFSYSNSPDKKQNNKVVQIEL